MKKKKILLSAYACEPNEGSEPGVGWNWAIELKKLGNKILVITRKNNEIKIKKYLKKNKILSIYDFYFFDLNIFFLKLKKILPFGLQIYYFLWQFYLYKNLKQNKFYKQYDTIHHITFGTFRGSSHLWKLNKNFILGPIGGHDLIPKVFKKEISFKSKILEFIREFINFLEMKFNKNLRYNLLKSKLILAKTRETKNFLKINLREKIKVKIASEIGLSNVNKNHKKLNINKINFLFIGRYIYIKGGDLILDAFKLAIKKNNNIRLNFYGEGIEKKRWKEKIFNYGLTNFIKINNKIKHSKIEKIYKKHDILVFGSLRDSSGNVVLEAMSHGLPVICFDTGGGRELVDNNCGIKIKIHNQRSKKEIIEKLSNIILKVASNSLFYEKLSKGAIQKAKSRTWKKIVTNVYSII